MGRPSKLPKFLEAMKEVLADERTVILTDSELLVAVNQKLKRKDKVGVSTFEAWKSPTMNIKSPENIGSIDQELVDEFREILAYARVDQKLSLTGKLMDSKNKNQWGSTWILERKYDDLKLRKEAETVHQPLIQITASNDDHKALIQNILNGEPIHLEPYKEKLEEIDIEDVEFIEEVEEDTNKKTDNE